MKKIGMKKIKKANSESNQIYLLTFFIFFNHKVGVGNFVHLWCYIHGVIFMGN